MLSNQLHLPRSSNNHTLFRVNTISVLPTVPRPAAAPTVTTTAAEDDEEPPIIIRRIGSRSEHERRARRSLQARAALALPSSKTIDWAPELDDATSPARRQGIRIAPPTALGYPRLWLDGYLFRRDRIVRPHMREYWRCTRKNCRGRLVLSARGAIEMRESHSCFEMPHAEEERRLAEAWRLRVEQVRLAEQLRAQARQLSELPDGARTEPAPPSAPREAPDGENRQ